MGIEVGSIDDALPGDPAGVRRTRQSVAIYLGDNKMVHAAVGEVVKVERSTARSHDPASWTPSDRPGPRGPSLDADRSFGPESCGRCSWKRAIAGTSIRRSWPLSPRSSRTSTPMPSVHAGAVGLMQFMPATAAGLGVDPTDPASSIDGAAQYLRQNLDQFGSISLALYRPTPDPGMSPVRRHPVRRNPTLRPSSQAIWSANAA
ncbi:MAG: transglycosylase SLT domain-containing protein [Acidimicrobiales bacterium]